MSDPYKLEDPNQGQRSAPLPVTATEACAHAGGAGAQPKALRPWYKMERFTPLLFLALLALIPGTASCGSNPAVTQPTASTAASESTKQVDPAPESPAQEATPGATTAAPKARAAAKPIEYSGRGEKSLRINKPSDGHQLISFTHSGRSDFTVHQLNANLEESENLVSRIGKYEGTTILDLNHAETKRIKIQADGKWTVRIADMSSATPLGSSGEGRGDEVLLYRGKGGVAQMTHKGESYFMVRFYSEDGATAERLVGSIGPYMGESDLGAGPGFVHITADGPWTIKVGD